jgi:protein-S-isoprenylcysteine O-methyltransferase Ste14
MNGRNRRNRVIAHEEAYLERKFGDDYCHFRTAVQHCL